MTGTQQDMDQLFMKRSNLSSYVKIIDYYGPCIVPKQIWYNADTVRNACSKDSNPARFDDIFTSSDEAFLLLVLKNYAAKWYIQQKNKMKPVRVCQQCILILVVIMMQYLTYYVVCRKVTRSLYR